MVSEETPSRADLRKQIELYEELVSRKFKEIKPPSFDIVNLNRFNAKMEKYARDMQEQYDRIVQRADYVLAGFSRMRVDDEPEKTISILLDTLGPDPHKPIESATVYTGRRNVPNPVK